MRDSNDYNEMSDLLDKYAGNVSVLEEEIDVELQMQYFKESKQSKLGLNQVDVLQRQADLFDSSLPYEDKRALLCQLASIDDVSAFRTIEKYVSNAEASLNEWAKLAFQESKMLLQSSLLDEAPLFISTGLGGRGTKLRYFVVVPSKNYKPFTTIQERIIQSELDFTFKRHGAEIENIEFFGYFVTITGLIPLKTGLKDFFAEIIQNCNNLGNFLSYSFLVTNVKKLSLGEIEDAIDKSSQEIDTDCFFD